MLTVSPPAVVIAQLIQGPKKQNAVVLDSTIPIPTLYILWLSPFSFELSQKPLRYRAWSDTLLWPGQRRRSRTQPLQPASTVAREKLLSLLLTYTFMCQRHSALNRFLGCGNYPKNPVVTGPAQAWLYFMVVCYKTGLLSISHKSLHLQVGINQFSKLWLLTCQLVVKATQTTFGWTPIKLYVTLTIGELLPDPRKHFSGVRLFHCHLLSVLISTLFPY